MKYTQLPDEGAYITIYTRNGRSVARLTPVVDTQLAADRILKLRANLRKGKLSMRGLINEGRR